MFEQTHDPIEASFDLALLGRERGDLRF